MVIKHFTRQRERLFLWAPVFLGLGIVIYFALRFEPPLYVGGAGAGASLVLIALLRAEKAALFSCLGIFLIFVGIGAAQISAVRHYTPLLDKPRAGSGRGDRLQRRAERNGKRQPGCAV